MLSIETARELYRQMEWADALVWRVAEGHPHDERLGGTLMHIHFVQRAFLHIWRGEAVEVPERASFPDLHAVLQYARPTYGAIRHFLDRLEPGAIDRPVTLPWAAELTSRLGVVPRATTLGETLFQVTSHSTYHRGQANARLRELGAEPPLTDFIAWVWLGRPEAQWP